MDEKTNPTVETEPVETKGENTAKKSPEKVDYEAEMKKLRDENEKLKKAQTAASKDASDWKAKYRSTQTEAEQAAAEKQEELNRILEENKTLKQQQTLATHKAGWLGLGFDENLASEAANASVDNDFDALMGIMKKFLELHDKEINAANSRNMPAPVSGSKTQSVTKEQFDSMGYRDRLKVFEEYPDLYKEFTKSL